MYRAACKKHNVADPVKALDKPVIVAHFLKDYSASVAAAAAAAPPPAAAAADDSVPVEHHHKREGREHRKSSKHKESSSSSKHHHHHRHHRKDHHHHKRSSSSSRHHSKESLSPKRKKPKPGMVTNEQLFKHLSVVVDKRQDAVASSGGAGAIEDSTTSSGNAAMMAAAITEALSPKGFEISGKEQLQPFKEKTAAILANEIPVGNSASILRANINNPRKDFSRVLELYMETVSSSKSSSSKTSTKGKPTAPISSKTKPSSTKKSGTTFKPYLVGKKPVIVVPKAMTAPLTLANAHEFLANARFVPRDVMVKTAKASSSPPPTTFTRTIKTSSGGGAAAGGSLLEYEIVDTPRKLGNNPREWERIVAVIVLGQAWQFKDWMQHPISYNVPATLFDNVYGFYIAMEGDKIPQDVSGWAVTSAKLNRDKRGLDSVTYASFWNGLDEWMKVYKSELLPQSQQAE